MAKGVITPGDTNPQSFCTTRIYVPDTIKARMLAVHAKTQLEVFYTERKLSPLDKFTETYVECFGRIDEDRIHSIAAQLNITIVRIEYV